MLLLLAMGVVGGVAAVALGRVRGGLEPPTSSLPQLDLPAGPMRPDDVEEIRFSLGLRGYRMDQVDAVLDRLRGELAQRDQLIEGLRGQLVEVVPDPRVDALPARDRDGSLKAGPMSSPADRSHEGEDVRGST